MSEETRIDKTAKVIMIIGFSLAALLIMAILGTGLYMFIRGVPMPQELSGWANQALGFIFGLLPGLLKDLMAKKTI